MARFQGTSRREVAFFGGFSTEKEEEGRLYAATYSSCDCRGGILRRGVGVAPYLTADESKLFVATPSEVNNIFPVHLKTDEDDREILVAIQEDGTLYEVSLKTGRAVERAQFDLPVAHYAIKTEKDKITHIFCSPQKVCFTTNGSDFYDCASGTGLHTCVVSGRCFVSVGRRTIKYSQPHAINFFDGTTDEGGKLYLPEGEGDIISLQAEGEYLYIFLQKEIYRVQVSANGMDFAMEQVEYMGGEICARSMAKTTKGIVFLSLSGVYVLRGKRAEQICLHLPVRPVDPFYVCQVGFCEELALIDYQALDEDGIKIVKRVAISAEDNDGFFCERYGALGGNDLCVVAGVVNQFVKDGNSAVYPYLPQFETRKLDFGTTAKKYLKRLQIEGKGKVEVSIQEVPFRGSGHTISYTFSLERGDHDVRLISSGKEFILRLCPAVGAEVHSLKIEYICMEGGYGY